MAREFPIRYDSGGTREPRRHYYGTAMALVASLLYIIVMRPPKQDM